MTSDHDTLIKRARDSEPRRQALRWHKIFSHPGVRRRL